MSNTLVEVLQCDWLLMQSIAYAMIALLNKYWCMWVHAGAIACHSLADDDVINTVFDLFL